MFWRQSTHKLWRRLSFGIGLAALAFIPTVYNSCAAQMKIVTSGTSTGSPLTEVFFLPYHAPTSFTDLKICLEGIKFVFSDPSVPDKFVTVPTAEITLDPLGTSIGNTPIPRGSIKEVDLALSLNCPSAQSLSFVSAGQSYSYSEKITLVFNGTMDLQGSARLNLEVKNIVDTFSAGTLPPNNNLPPGQFFYNQFTTTVWTGAAGPGNLVWQNPTNWKDGKIPDQNTIVVFAGGCIHCTSTVDRDFQVAALIINSNFDGQIFQANPIKLTVGTNFEKYGGIYSLSGSLDVNGDFEVQGGSFSTADPTTLFVAGNFKVFSALTGNGKIKLDGIGDQSIAVTSTLPAGDFTIEKSGGTAITTTNLILNRSPQSFYLLAGTFNLGTNSLTVFDLIRGTSGHFVLDANATISSARMDFGMNAFVDYVGDQVYTSLALGYNYESNVTFSGSGSWLPASPLSCRNLIIQSGATLDTGMQNLNVREFWNYGTWNHGPARVTLWGNANTIRSGTAVFFDLSRINATPASLKLVDDLTVTNNLTLQGPIQFGSSVAGVAKNISLPGTYNFQNVHISDLANALPGTIDVRGMGCTDDGNNLGWLFN